jgi:hypothetical protein
VTITGGRVVRLADDAIVIDGLRLPLTLEDRVG